MVSRLFSMCSSSDLYHTLQSYWPAHHKFVGNSKRKCIHWLRLFLVSGRAILTVW
jgi:hypothetical protein